MAYRQPRVPEYRERDDVKGYMKPLILFLKEFAMSAWRANNARIREIEAVRRAIPEMPEIPEVHYPVTSVNGKTGDVKLQAQDVGALGRSETAADSEKLEGKTWAQAMLALHPVGSIYLSVSSTSPASLFGGTWEMLQDRFLIGAGGSYGAGATGGAETHKLTINEMPKHDHNVVKKNTYDRLVMMAAVQNGYGNAGGSGGSGTWYWNYGVPAQGGNAAHNNMPPYLAVYMWKRTA